jgi:hypothetical protein
MVEMKWLKIGLSDGLVCPWWKLTSGPFTWPGKFFGHPNDYHKPCNRRLVPHEYSCFSSLKNNSVLQLIYFRIYVQFVRSNGFFEHAFRNCHNKRYARNWQLHASLHERPGLLIISRQLSHETKRSFSNFCSIRTSGKIQNYQLRQRVVVLMLRRTW